MQKIRIGYSQPHYNEFFKEYCYKISRVVALRPESWKISANTIDQDRSRGVPWQEFRGKGMWRDAVFSWIPGKQLGYASALKNPHQLFRIFPVADKRN
jgi:hypothetical protein